jgi:hypothetical protein
VENGPERNRNTRTHPPGLTISIIRLVLSLASTIRRRQISRENRERISGPPITFGPPITPPLPSQNRFTVVNTSSGASGSAQNPQRRPRTCSHRYQWNRTSISHATVSSHAASSAATTAAAAYTIIQ